MVHAKPVGLLTGLTILAFSCNVANTTPPTPNAMGTKFKLLSKGSANLVEISLNPTTDFDSVDVVAASGTDTLSPPCSFSSVVVGGSYVCRVTVTHIGTEASLTLNVVGTRTVDPDKPRLFEVSHYTIANAAYVAPKARRSPKVSAGMVLSSGKEKQ